MKSELDIQVSRPFRHATIVMLRKRGSCPIAPSGAPENPFIGAILPYSPLHHILLREFGGPLVMTSANLAEEPIIYRVHDALNRMRDVAPRGIWRFYIRFAIEVPEYYTFSD